MPSLLYETTGPTNESDVVWNQQEISLPEGRFQVQFVFTMGYPFESAAGLDSVKLSHCLPASNDTPGLELPGNEKVRPVHA